ncbi:hypothetical protein PSECIP111951_00576 [Pseudoalteromonas holothuriae]|nr:hypothetical protein PSECIP111951_00576 [Pseudoalteromonas sp. CIP111951]
MSELKQIDNALAEQSDSEQLTPEQKRQAAIKAAVAKAKAKKQAKEQEGNDPS